MPLTLGEAMYFRASMIACVSYYDRNLSRHDNAFADYCEKLFRHRINFLETVLELVKTGKIDPHEASNMENSFGVMTTQGRRVRTPERGSQLTGELRHRGAETRRGQTR